MRPNDVGRIEAFKQSKSQPMLQPRVDLLDQAIDACDLPELILEQFPDANTKGCFQTVTRARFCAVWRDERTPSFDIHLKGTRWLYFDRGQERGGNAFTFLTDIAKRSRREATQILLHRAGIDEPAALAPLVNSDERSRNVLRQRFYRECPGADPDFFESYLEFLVESGGPLGSYKAEGTVAWSILENADFVSLRVLAVLKRPLDGNPQIFRELDQLTRWALGVLADFFAENTRPYLESTSTKRLSIKLERAL